MKILFAPVATTLALLLGTGLVKVKQDRVKKTVIINGKEIKGATFQKNKHNPYEITIFMSVNDSTAHSNIGNSQGI